MTRIVKGAISGPTVGEASVEEVSRLWGLEWKAEGGARFCDDSDSVRLTVSCFTSFRFGALRECPSALIYDGMIQRGVVPLYKSPCLRSNEFLMPKPAFVPLQPRNGGG